MTSTSGKTAHANPARAVRQHALTSRFLGVDFVPIFPEKVPITKQDTGASASNARGGSAGTGSASGGEVELIPPARTDWHTVDDKRAAAQKLLDAIRARYEKDQPHAKFVTAHTNIVFGEGDPCARLMFIGEAPGLDEDRTGRPFVGRAGQLLARMIYAMGLSRHEVYIANVLKTRPPNNATPTSEEAAACAPYLYDQIAAVRPEVIVTLGLPASRIILQTEEAMSRMRGSWASWSHPDTKKHPGLTIPVMPTFHPAFLLRQYTQENRNKVWSDLKQVMTKLGLQGRKKG